MFSRHLTDAEAEQHGSLGLLDRRAMDTRCLDGVPLVLMKSLGDVHQKPRQLITTDSWEVLWAATTIRRTRP